MGSLLVGAEIGGFFGNFEVELLVGGDDKRLVGGEIFPLRFAGEPYGQNTTYDRDGFYLRGVKLVLANGHNSNGGGEGLGLECD